MVESSFESLRGIAVYGAPVTISTFMKLASLKILVPFYSDLDLWTVHAR